MLPLSFQHIRHPEEGSPRHSANKAQQVPGTETAPHGFVRHSVHKRRRQAHPESDCPSHRLCRPQRTGLGIEQDAAVIEGPEKLMGLCADPQGFTRQVNQELRRLWESQTGYDPDAERKRREIEGKVGNVRQAIEDGLSDASWANDRLRELLDERAKLEAATVKTGPPPQIDPKTALAYRANLGKVLTEGDMAERKKLVRAWVQEMKLAPASLEVEITYQLPEPVVNCVVARASFVAMHYALGGWLSRRWRLPTKGRRPAR